MAAPVLNTLPTEVLDRICEYLETTHHESLVSFSCVDRVIRSIAVRLLFRSISLEIFSRKKLHLEVDGWRELLSQNGCLEYVRQVEVGGWMPSLAQDEDALEDPHAELDWYGDEEIYGDKRKKGKKASMKSSGRHGRVLFGSSSAPFSPPALEFDEAWQPLVQLLDALPKVTDLIWDLESSAFPPRVLDRIERYEPRCRLHHKNFRFASLAEPQLDAFEARLASSPSLHEIHVYYTWRDSGGIDDHNEEAVRDMVAGMSPNLKKLKMISCRPASSPQLQRAMRTPRAAWTGLRGVSFPFRKATLTDLLLECYLSADTLMTWSKHVDFSQIRRLSLSSKMTGGALYHAARHCSFPLLEDLYTTLDRNDERQPQPDFSEHAIMFISSLAPLKKLVLSGSLEEEVFDCVLEHHGRTLQQLYLVPHESMYSTTVKNNPFVFTKAHVERLQLECPLLEDLQMPIKRSKSDATELQTYQIFSRFARLQTLFLKLNCSNPEATCNDRNLRDPNRNPPNDPSFDEYYSQRSSAGMGLSPQLGHIRDGLINSAVDEKLARSIWAAITERKVGLPLQQLKLHTSGGYNFGNNSYSTDMSDIFEEIERSWCITPNARDDQDEIDVYELSAAAREGREMEKQKNKEYLKTTMGDRYREPPHPKDNTPRPNSTMEIFLKIWPSEKGVEGWKDAWSSFPLPTT